MKLTSTCAATLLLAGCATMTRGTSQEFTVESTPPGASVSTSNGFECAATPCTFRMPRKDGFTVRVEHEGFRSAEATVVSNMASGGAAGMAGNILVGGIIGMGVDATSGAMNDLTPNPLHITLEPIPVVAAEPATTEAAEAAAVPDAAVDATAADAAPAVDAAASAVDAVDEEVPAEPTPAQ